LSLVRSGIRRCLAAFGHRVVRWLVRVAPKLVSFGATVSSDELERANCVREVQFAVPITTGHIRFTLLTPDHFGLTQGKRVRDPWVQYLNLSKRGKVYEPMMLACLTRLIQRTGTSQFMDIGAFLGYYACYASALTGNRQMVYAIESNPLFAKAIRESARVNGFSQLRVFQAALSDRVESVSIDGLTVRHDADSLDKTITLDTITLDDLCDRENLRPTIIKMDVHGAEGKIVLGMRNTLAEVEYLLLEMHSLRYMRNYSPGVTRTAMLDALEDAGLTLYYLAGHHANEASWDLQELLAGRAYSYRKLDRQARDLLLFDRREDEFVLALRHGDVGSLLGPNVSPANE
jgi:FkbM family methyltransferase